MNIHLQELATKNGDDQYYTFTSESWNLNFPKKSGARPVLFIYRTMLSLQYHPANLLVTGEGKHKETVIQGFRVKDLNNPDCKELVYFEYARDSQGQKINSSEYGENTSLTIDNLVKCKVEIVKVDFTHYGKYKTEKQIQIADN